MDKPPFAPVAKTMQAIRHSGYIFRVSMAPFETDDRAADRAWFIAKEATATAAAAGTPLTGGTMSVNWPHLVSKSHIFCNDKHLGIKCQTNEADQTK